MRSAIAFALSLMTIPMAFAQDDRNVAQSSDAQIVVEGERLTEKEARQRATGFVRTLGVVQGDRSVARWTRRICPRVMGLSPQHAALVEGWFRDAAAKAGAKLASGKCDTNFLIAFVESGEAFMQSVKARRPTALYAVDNASRRSLVNGDAPVRWWYGTGFGGGDGSRPDGGSLAATSTPAGIAGGGEGGSSMLPDGVPSGASISASMIRTSVVRTIESATIVIDVNQAQGATLDAVTKFATFVGLAEVKSTATPDSASILNLFSDRARVNELSDWDRAFLKELYVLPLNRSGRRHRGRLIAAMVDQDGAPE